MSTEKFVVGKKQKFVSALSLIGNFKGECFSVQVIMSLACGANTPSYLRT